MPMREVSGPIDLQRVSRNICISSVAVRSKQKTERLLGGQYSVNLSQPAPQQVAGDPSRLGVIDSVKDRTVWLVYRDRPSTLQMPRRRDALDKSSWAEQFICLVILDVVGEPQFNDERGIGP